VAAEAALGGVPVLALVAHLALVDADRVATRVAELGEQPVEAAQAKGPPVPHDVPLAAQLLVALKAREVLHVPRAALRLRALVRQNNLRKAIFSLAPVKTIRKDQAWRDLLSKRKNYVQTSHSRLILIIYLVYEFSWEFLLWESCQIISFVRRGIWNIADVLENKVFTTNCSIELLFTKNFKGYKYIFLTEKRCEIFNMM
jgi:hypothetical protein